LLLVKSGGFSSYSLKRFLDNFARGADPNRKISGLTSLWKVYMSKTCIPHNKGKKNLPYVTEEYRKEIGKGGRGRLNNPGLRCKPWVNNRACKESTELWKIADYVYYHYQFIPKKKGTNGSYRLAQALGLKMSETVSNMVLAFNGRLKSLCPGGSPWIPEEDEDWISFSCDDIV
jgi:hypothetical protein